MSSGSFWLVRWHGLQAIGFLDQLKQHVDRHRLNTAALALGQVVKLLGWNGPSRTQERKG